LEKIKEFKNSIHLLFIDFKSGYGSTDREQMYEYLAMNKLIIPQKLISLVKMIISNMQSQTKFSRSSQHLS